MKSIALLLLGLSLLLAGCINADKTAKLGESFQLKVNQTAYIESEGLLIELDDIPEDSRCPVDVVCVWAGQTRVKLNVGKAGMDEATIEIRSANGSFSDNEGNAYSVQVIKVEPAPRSNRTIALTEYVVTLKISKQ
ncbi:MAG: hypothetical protein ACXABY_17230 [Candidatus Thorarchaeota archaeon]